METRVKQINTLLDKAYFNFNYQDKNYLYDFFKNFSNTTIFIQYNPEAFLSFKVYEASQGILMYLSSRELALQCQIRGTTYTFNREHIAQMSYRECHELFNQLGVDGSQFFRD